MHIEVKMFLFVSKLRHVSSVAGRFQDGKVFTNLFQQHQVAGGEVPLHEL